jgi:phospholipase C
MPVGDRRSYDRRTVLRAGLGAATAAALPLRLAGTAAGSVPARRSPGALPYPSRPVGRPTGALPFDHLVIVMQENHSFDNYLGMLPRRGQPLADGFTVNAAGEPTNWNPVGKERMHVYHQSGEVGSQDTGSQS